MFRNAARVCDCRRCVNTSIRTKAWKSSAYLQSFSTAASPNAERDSQPLGLHGETRTRTIVNDVTHSAGFHALIGSIRHLRLRHVTGKRIRSISNPRLHCPVEAKYFSHSSWVQVENSPSATPSPNQDHRQPQTDMQEEAVLADGKLDTESILQRPADSRNVDDLSIPSMFKPDLSKDESSPTGIPIHKKNLPQAAQAKTSVSEIVSDALATTKMDAPPNGPKSEEDAVKSITKNKTVSKKINTKPAPTKKPTATKTAAKRVVAKNTPAKSATLKSTPTKKTAKTETTAKQVLKIKKIPTNGPPAPVSKSAYSKTSKSQWDGSTGDIVTITGNEAASLMLKSIDMEHAEIPSLSHGLSRVLFNPGVYHLQDPRTRVYNFDPYLKFIMPVEQFDFKALKDYVTSSQDLTLGQVAQQNSLKYVGSTSSMTSVLAHFHFLLSQWRGIQLSGLSKSFPEELQSFTQMSRAPASIFLRWNSETQTYAIDADKEFTSANVLMMLGKVMEKLLTQSKDDYERYRRSDPRVISEEEREAPEAYHYSSIGKFLIRSQLDAYDPRLPGSGVFDIKTRAVVTIRMDADEYEKGMGYQIRQDQGQWESYEREYYDMMRATMLKYSLQARLGRMDGIFVAYHNVERIFGFQYISLEEMDRVLHDSTTRVVGDTELGFSLELLGRVFDQATARFPEQSLRIHFDTRDVIMPFTYIFAEPMTEAEIDEIQKESDEKVEAFEAEMMGKADSSSSADPASEWQRIKDLVQNEIDDEMGVPMPDHDGTSVPEEDNGSFAAQRNLDQIEAEASDAKVENEILEDEDLKSVETGELLGQSPDDAAEASEAMQGASASEVVGDFEVEDTDALVDAAGTFTEAAESAGDDISTLFPTMKSALIGDSPTANATADETTDRPTKGILGLTLTIRNRVSGNYAKRPGTLSGPKQWSLEYSLAEIKDPARAHSLYKAVKARRKRQLVWDKSRDRYYQDKMAKLSERGRMWRTKQDELDREAGTVVYKDEELETTAVMEENEVSEELEEADSHDDIEVSVDGYLGWLYADGDTPYEIPDDSPISNELARALLGYPPIAERDQSAIKMTMEEQATATEAEMIEEAPEQSEAEGEAEADDVERR